MITHRSGYSTSLGKKAAVADLNPLTCLSSSSHGRQEGRLTSCYEFVNYLLVTYAPDNMIAEDDR